MLAKVYNVCSYFSMGNGYSIPRIDLTDKLDDADIDKLGFFLSIWWYFYYFQYGLIQSPLELIRAINWVISAPCFSSQSLL